MKIKFGMEGVHKMFTFGAGQNRIFTAYQVEVFFYETKTQIKDSS